MESRSFNYRYGLYAVRDRVAETFGPVFCAVNNGVAMRMFKNMVDSDKVDPSDYQLYRLGFYDDSKGYISNLEFAEEVLDESVL